MRVLCFFQRTDYAPRRCESERELRDNGSPHLGRYLFIKWPTTDRAFVPFVPVSIFEDPLWPLLFPSAVSKQTQHTAVCSPASYHRGK